MKIKNTVFIVDDDPGDLQYLQSVLSKAGFPTRGFETGRSFLREAASGASCVLLDVNLPDIEGLAVISESLAKDPTIPFVMISGVADIPIAVKAMKLGAVDFVEKPVDPAKLVDTVARAIDERAQAHAGEHNDIIAKQPLMQKLTPREREVLRLLLEGYQNKMIAYELGISQRTVEVHRARIMTRLNVKSFAELVRVALACKFNMEEASISQAG